MSDLTIRFEDVSKFYGEVLGVNRVELDIPPGITSLVGPNGSGKTTLMNLVSGLLQPSQGKITVRGIDTDDPERLFRELGYCTQYDSFPKGMRGLQFIRSYLRVHGYDAAESQRRAEAAITRVNLMDAADRRVAGYSKGMRQRVKLAQSIAHDPSVLILDEPLNGLDPMARAEMISLFQELAEAGKNVIISSHILHEVDLISNQVILLNEGYVVAEGGIQDVRGEMDKHPLQILIRCDKPSLLASKVFEMDSVVEVKIDPDQQGLLLKTKDADNFFSRLNHLVLDHEIKVERVAPADDDVQAVYQYLIGQDKGQG
ncbi:MAG: ABC transporter ATP-binding protein [Acidobacteriota bacterium]|nr:ABC transporter ATP-binding protein [Acidobacteriota bacterium]MDH3784522.1 ABC transporter ATP-binding protein [Acidobacteriota bacterium]